jgi:glycosyltransferase involved in cell wall biosynthesis
VKISVCIPTYNQALFIEQAVRSAVNQTLPPFEVIVSNDCSTDNTADILARLSFELHSLKVINQSNNLGIAKNTDQCLRAASGDYIVRLDSDDYLSPDYIEKLSKLLTANPTAGYAHAAIQEVDSKGKLLAQRKLFRPSGFQKSDDALKSALKGYRVAANIIMFRKAALKEVGYLTGRPNFGEDYHLTASISSKGYGNVYLDEVLAFYRVWLDAGHVRQKRKLSEIDGLRRVFEEVIEPAFKERAWDLRTLKKSRTNFACLHSDCLSWNVYNDNEKNELALELARLSTAPKAKLYGWLFSNGLGNIITSYSRSINYSKKLVKKIAKI